MDLFEANHISESDADENFHQTGVLIAPFTLKSEICDYLVSELNHTAKFEEPVARKSNGIDEFYYHVEHLSKGFSALKIKEISGSPKLWDYGRKFFDVKFNLYTSDNVLRFSKPEHKLDWHSDRVPHEQITRLLGFSIILSKPDSGGDFEIKNTSTGRIEIVKPEKGQIHLFDITNEKYIHRVNPINGNAPRISISGWFVDFNVDGDVK